MAAPLYSIPRPHCYTVAEYHRMGESGIFLPDARVELIDGEIIDMTPIGSRHAGIVKRLIRVFSRAVGDGAIVAAQDPISLGDFSEPQPDLALLRFREDFYARSHPRPEEILLVVEVSDATLQYDREVKLPLYARAGIPEAWLVDVDAGALEIHRRPSGGRYVEQERFGNPEKVEVSSLPGIGFDLSGLLD